MVDWAGTGWAVVSILAIVFATAIVCAVLALFWWLWFRNKKFSQFKCVIWRRDGFGNIQESYDTAGIFVQAKTQNKRFYMRKNRVGLTPDKVPYVPTGKGEKTVYLLQFGLKNFAFIKPNIAGEENLSLTVGEEDVNWAVNAYEAQKKRFNFDKLMQFLPFISLAIVSVFILILFIYLFKKFDVIAAAATSLKETAQIQAAGGGGGAIVP